MYLRPQIQPWRAFLAVFVALLWAASGWTAKGPAKVQKPRTRILATDTNCFAAAAEADVPGRTVDPFLQAHAQAHAEAMASAGFIFHTGWNPALGPQYETSTFTDAQFRSGWPQDPPYVVLAENVGDGESCQVIQSQFDASVPHRINLTNKRTTLYGIGTALSPDGTTLYVTEDFGAPAAPKPVPRPTPGPAPPAPPRPVPKAPSCGV